MTGWGNVCTGCHNSTLGNNVSAVQVKAGWTNNDCLDCHASGTGNPDKIGNWHSKYGTASHQGTTTQGCGTSGIGCHNTLDLAALHGLTETNGCALAGCHDAVNKDMTSAAKSCGSGGACHNTYTATSHGATTGNEADHTAVSMTTTVGPGPNTSCASCHSAGLTNAHPTSMTGWADVCMGCHNSTLGNSVSPAQVAANWTNNLCTDCHATGTSNPNKIGNWHSKYGPTAHDGVSTQPSNCLGACHKSGSATDLGVIHSTATAGCKVTGCHATDKDMTSAAKSCGPGGACHTDAKYADGGSHGFSLELHTTTDQNSWKNCGRCHLGYRADYTRTGTFNGHLVVDSDSPTLNELHRKASHGGNGCSTCHDGGATQALIDGGATANCGDCHVDHRVEATASTLTTTTSTSSTNLVKTVYLDFTGQSTSNISIYLATSDNGTPAYARAEIGTGTPLYSTGATSTTAMDPLRKKYYFKNIDVSGITGIQPVRLYVWSGGSGQYAINDKFEVCASRGDMITMHSADVGQFTCGFGDCHDANVVSQHQPYEIPGAFTGTYSWPTNPSKEDNATATGPASTTLTKIKSLTLNMQDVDKIRVRLNLYCADTTARTLSFQLRVGGTTIASGSYLTTSVQRWWDFSQGGTDPAGGNLDYINTTAFSGTTTFDLWVSTSRATAAGAARNSAFQIWAGDRVYAASTPTDACDLCHLNTARLDDYGNIQSNDTSLGPDTPKLSTFDPQCDTCHPAWETGHPEFSHMAPSSADTCLKGCHEYYPPITGTYQGTPGKYDLLKQHIWGDNSGAGLSFTPGSALVALDNFGTTTTWPSNWTRSNTTYVTNQTGSSRSGAAPQIGVNTTRTEYNFYKTDPIDASHYAGGGLIRFWYQVNVGDTSDFLVCEYSTESATGPYTEIWRQNTDALSWTQSPYLMIPKSSTVWIRFRGTFNTTGEYGRIDDFEAFGSVRTFPGEMEGGCAVGPNGMCHSQKYPTSGKCSDCHASVNHHNTIHDVTVGGTRPNSNGVATGFTLDSCLGTCHEKSLHYTHGVSLKETDPRPYRGPGMASDEIMGCETCHNSANATVKNIANSTATPIADMTLKCADCHTGTTGMASAGHAGVSTSWRTGQPLVGANIGNEYSTSFSVSGHRAGPFTTAYRSVFYVDTGGTGSWYTTNPGGKTMFTFDCNVNAPGTTGAAALLRANTISSTGGAGDPLKLSGTTTLNTSVTLHCADCHGESATGLDGPQGAATSVGLYEGFTSYRANTGWFTSGTVICNRCHNTGLYQTSPKSLKAANGGHLAGCTNCHIAIPHAWKRPKLLVSTSRDPAPYVLNGSLHGWKSTNHTASNSWSTSGNCYSTNCKGHGSSANLMYP
jgi:hypothetical protein